MKRYIASSDILMVALMLAGAMTAAAGHFTTRAAPSPNAPTFNSSAVASNVIRLPNGSKPKAFTFGNSTDLFVCTLSGEVLHLDTADNSSDVQATLLAKEPGIALAGIAYDAQQHALFIAGTVSGKTYVYFLSGAKPYKVTRRVAVPLARIRKWQAPYVNDVTLGPDHAFYTDSFEPLVHVIPRFAKDIDAAIAASNAEPDGSSSSSSSEAGSSGSSINSSSNSGGSSSSSITFYRLGPSFVSSVGRLNANGLVFARENELLVSNFDQSYVAKVHLPPGGKGGNSNATVLLKLPVLAEGSRGLWPKVWADSMIMGESNDTVYLSDNFEDRVLQLKLSPDLSSASISCVIQPRLADGRMAIRTPTGLFFKDGLLWVLNARLLDCPFVLPCTWQSYEIVGMRPGDVC